MRPGQLMTVEDVMAFMLAGNATLTFASTVTGTRFTYRVRKSEPNEDGSFVHFVQVLTGTDNEADYTYLGTIRDGVFKHGRKTKIGADAPSAKAFDWVAWQVLEKKQMPGTLAVWHEGRCGKCGRKLTVPESIERGIGPDCAGQMAVAA